MSKAADTYQHSLESLSKFRLDRFRRLSSIVTLIAVAYAILVIQFTPLFASNRYFLEFFAIAAGTANFLVYRFLPDSFFKPNVNFVLELINLAAVAFIVQITGGLSSPFSFFYPIITLSAIVTLGFWKAVIIFVLVLELLVANFLISTNTVSVVAGSFVDLLLSIARVAILGTYSILLVTDMYAEEQKNLVVGSQLQQHLLENNLTTDLDREIASRKPLGEILSTALEKVAKEFNSHFGLIILRDEANKRWRTAATFNLEARGEKELNPEKIKEDLIATIDKNKKTLLIAKPSQQNHLRSLDTLGLNSLLISPIIFEDQLLGTVVLGHHKIAFEETDREFLSRLSAKFGLTIANALALEAQDALFKENEKIANESQEKMQRMENLLKIKGLEV